jgi:hypothetical protein
MAGILMLALAPVSGCDSITGCDEESRVVEVEYGILEASQRTYLQTLRNTGWSCNSDGSIRNAFGNVIGERYACTKCE